MTKFLNFISNLRLVVHSVYPSGYYFEGFDTENFFQCIISMSYDEICDIINLRCEVLLIVIGSFAINLICSVFLETSPMLLLACDAAVTAILSNCQKEPHSLSYLSIPSTKGIGCQNIGQGYLSSRTHITKVRIELAWSDQDFFFIGNLIITSHPLGSLVQKTFYDIIAFLVSIILI